MTANWAPAHDNDPDAGDNPFVLHGRPLRPEVSLDSTSRFSDPVWRLEPAQLQGQQTALCLNFNLLAAPHQLLAKHLCYAMLSGPLPVGENRVGINTIRKRLTDIRRFLEWLPIERPRVASVTAADLLRFQRHLLATMPSPGARMTLRMTVRLLWRYRAVLPDGLTVDPNRLRGWNEQRVARTAENATDRVPEPVMGPLLVWAFRFVDDFAPDILAANRLRTRMRQPASPFDKSRPLGPALDALIDDYRARGRPLPGHHWRTARDPVQLNVQMIARTLGCRTSSLTKHLPHLRRLEEAARELGVSEHSAFDVSIAGQLDGRPWVPGIYSQHEAELGLARLMRHLQAACYILIAYLSGMRDSEVKHLRRGCLRTHRDPAGRPYRWTVTSRAFKGEADPAGIEATWVVGGPAARAVAVLEQLQERDVDWLFAILPVGPGMGPATYASTTVLGVTATINQINAFAAWVNDYCQARDRADAIPDVDGRPWRLTTRQFRRTLSWFIAWRPGGAIAGSIQYRHHSVQMFEGYAGTSDSGFRAEVEAERALARGQTLLAMADRHDHDTFTGPAASEAASRLEAFGRQARFAGAVVTDRRRLQRLMTREDPAVYPGQFVTCVFNPGKALCLPRGDNSSQPAILDCRPLECANVAVSDTNREQWQQQLDDLDRQLDSAAALPPLLAARLKERRDTISAFTTRNRDQGEPAR